jgi:regulator of replication initiation timing
VRAKEEALDRLEKQLSGGSREVSDLRNDVKQHKREEERLRRELKKTL